MPYESRLLSTQLSSVYTPSKGFPAKLTSYVQNSPATLWPVADGIRKQYYDLNRISCISKEDIAYLVEWNMDMRAMVSYGYVGS